MVSARWPSLRTSARAVGGLEREDDAAVRPESVLDDALFAFAKEGRIRGEDAWLKASNKKRFEGAAGIGSRVEFRNPPRTAQRGEVGERSEAAEGPTSLRKRP